MEFRQLEYFVAVAQELSYNRAAKKLNISQPAITKQIQLLEYELDVELFDKNVKDRHKKIVLTEEGQYFYIEAQKLINQSALIKENLFNYRNKKRIVKLGVFQMMPKNAIFQILKKLIKENNNYLLKVIEFGTYEEVNDALLHDEIQLGVTLQYIDNEDFISRTVRKGRLGILMNRKHILASKKLLQIKQLKDEKWIDFSTQLKQDRNKIEILFTNEGIIRKNNIIQEVNSYEMLETLIKLNYGIALLPDFIINENAELVFVPLEPESPLAVEINEVIRYKKGNNSGLVKTIFDNFSL